MKNSIFKIPAPQNEPVGVYAPGDPRRKSLHVTLEKMSSEKIEIPLFIGNREIRTGNTRQVVMPHQHQHVLAEFHLAGPAELKLAEEEALKAKESWERLSWEQRAAVFLKAADLLAGSWRDRLNAATMLGQSKNVYQAEIDSACELIDFFRFNASFYERILQEQPVSSPGIWNQSEYRPLEGFVLAVTPFNFTAISGNLIGAPALVGNTVVWKPSNTQIFSAYYLFKLLQEAGLPAGVINFIPCEGAMLSRTLMLSPHLAGVHFTGSTSVFQGIFKTVGENIASYRTYPRLVGETGGKDFVFADSTADEEALVTALVRGAFEYQGQKCSAASRAYVPKSLWPRVKSRLCDEIRSLRMGDVRDFRNFMNAVIDEKAFDSIVGYQQFAKTSSDAQVLIGGDASKKEGYFIEPTVIETSNPAFKTMVEEIFGPVLTVFPYDDDRFEETLDLCDTSSPYALTGAIFSQDRNAIDSMRWKLRNAAGNFYINDKPTGAVVGQQPFGGARSSGTNDKAGSALNLYRWISARTVKETFQPPRDYRYPFMREN